MQKENTPKFYLIHVRMNDDNISIQHAHEIFVAIKEFAKGNCQPVFTTKDGGSFGFIVKTDMPIAAMYAKLEGTEIEKYNSPFLSDDKPFIIKKCNSSILLNGDKFFIIEIGADYAEKGFNVPFHWMKHN